MLSDSVLYFKIKDNMMTLKYFLAFFFAVMPFSFFVSEIGSIEGYDV